MTAWLNIAEFCKGISWTYSSTSYLYVWTGYSFLPTYSYQGISSSNFDYDSLAAYDSTATYDHTDFRPGNESVFFIWSVQCDAPYSGTLFWKLYGPDGNLITNDTTSINLNPSPGRYAQTYSWRGWGMHWIPGTREIDKDGTYRMELTGAFTGTYTCDVTNLNTAWFTKYDKGYVWIQGDNIWCIDGYGYKKKVNNDGADYGDVGIDNAGYIWIETGSNRIDYIDESGHHRKTHIGDIYGVDGTSLIGGTINAGVGNAGYFYVKDAWSYLYFVNSSGYAVRIGNGYVYGDGP